MTSIVMIGRNRLALTKQSIESLYANTPGDNWTLTYLDDSSDDFRCLKYLRSITRKNFMLLEVSSGSSHVLSQLKNIGAYVSEMRWGRGDWLYFSDNDVWFSPDWLNKLTVEFAEKIEHMGFRLFGGQVHPFHQSDGGKIFTSLESKHEDRPDGNSYQILDGPSWLMRWNTWDLYGPFDRATAPGVCQSEEYPFCQRLTMPFGGCRIGVIHPHVVVHTGLSNTDGTPAPGAAERRALIPLGVLAE